MKKLIFFIILILMLTVGITVSAHECRYDFFDFENYTGNSSTLSVLPKSGTWGEFALNNRSGTDGNDGVTSETTDKGTSLVLVRKYAKYPGVYYRYSTESYDVTDTIHSSLSFKISGSIPEGYGVFRFRKRGNSSPYDIAIFKDNGTISILGESLKKDGGYIYYSKNKWYDLDVVYDVKSGYCKVHITDNDGFDIYREGCSGYEKSLTSIQLVMFETIGSAKEPYTETKIYLDNWKIETVKKLYAENEPLTFEDFATRLGGSSVPKGYMLTGFASKSDSTSGYSGVFTEEEESGKCLVLAQNINKPLTLSGSFKNKIVEPWVIETDVKLKSLNSDTVIYLGNSKEGYADTIRIEANTGNVYACLQKTGIRLMPDKSYHLTLAFDPKTNQGYFIADDGKQSSVSKFVTSGITITWVNAYRLALENHTNFSGNEMKVLFDNIKLSSRDNIYHPMTEVQYAFDISEYMQESENTFLVRMNNPIDWNDSFVARVNREVASAQKVDAYTVRITYPMNPGEANIKLAGIADIFGNSVNTNCEIQKISMPDGFIVSNPVFLADRLGVESFAHSLAPGDLNAVINIKKVN